MNADLGDEDRLATIRRVVLESPYAGNVKGNLRYARECLLDSLRRGEAPLASHLLYTQVLDDANPDERAQGIAAGLAWRSVAECSVFYVDRGWSRGMLEAKAGAERGGHTIEERRLYPAGDLRCYQRGDGVEVSGEVPGEWVYAHVKETFLPEAKLKLVVRFHDGSTMGVSDPARIRFWKGDPQNG